MNKKYWYTIILDGSISLKDIYINVLTRVIK